MNDTNSASGASDPLGMPSRTPERTSAVQEHSRRLASAAAATALANKAQDVLVMEVSNLTALFDYFVIATGTSRRQLHAISEEIDDVLQVQLGDRRVGIEGYEESRWIVLDYGSVVIHLFDEETRQYYDLESLWADARLVPLSSLGIETTGEARRSGGGDD